MQHRLACSARIPAVFPASIRRPLARQRRVRVAADLHGMVDGLVTTAALAAGVGACLFTLGHAWPRQGEDSSRRGQQAGAVPGAPLHAADNTAWAVMGVVACLPLFNSMVR